MKNIFLKKCAGITAFLILATQLMLPAYAAESVDSASSSGATNSQANTSASTTSEAESTFSTATTTLPVDATKVVEEVVKDPTNSTPPTVETTVDSVMKSLEGKSESAITSTIQNVDKAVKDKLNKINKETKKNPKKRAKFLKDIAKLKKLQTQLRVKALKKNKKIVDKIKKIVHRKGVYEVRWGNLTGKRKACVRATAQEIKDYADNNKVPEKCLAGIPKAKYKAKISVNVGTLKVRKKILFEKNDKVTVASGSSIGFESVIAGHWDGLIVEYIPPVTTSTATNKELEITLSIGDLNKTYKGSEIFGRKKIDKYHMIHIKPLLKALPGLTKVNTDRLVEHKVKVQERLSDLHKKLDRLRLLNKGGSGLDEIEKAVEDVTNYNFDDTSSTEMQAEIDKLLKELKDDVTPAAALKKAAALKRKVNNTIKIAKFRKYSKQLIPFKDTDDSEWFTKYVAAVKKRGVVGGYKDKNGNELGEFRPANNVTVAEILKIGLETAEKGKAVGKTPKLRVAVNHWAKAYAAKAEDLGLDLVKSTKSLDRPATRGEVIRMVLEALEINHDKITSTDYTDVKVGDASAPYIQYAKKLGIVSGDDGKTTFRPNAPINRAEVSKIADLVNDVIMGGSDTVVPSDNPSATPINLP